MARLGATAATAAAATLAVVSAEPAADGAPTLSVNATTIRHLDWVRVTYSGLPVGDDNVWFGVFYPANATVTAIPAMDYPATPPWTAQAPMKFISCSSMPGCLTGAGTYDFELVNPFEDAAIWAFTGGLTAPVPLARTPTITFADVDAPLRGHLARTADPTEARVVWHSRHNDDNPAAKWGTTPGGPYPYVAFAEAYQYGRGDLCGAPATGPGWFPSHYWLHATMTGLTPGTVAYYVYGSDANGWSEEASFATAPPPGADTPVHAVLCADMGMTELDGTTDHWAEPSAASTTAHMRDWVNSGSGHDYSLALHVGDVSYATGYLLKWELFNSRIAGLADRVFYSVVQGNHERDWPGTGSIVSYDSGGECGIPTQTRFPAPTATPSMSDEGWFSFVHGSATVVMVNTEFELGPGSTQWQFVTDALSGVNRSVTPWVIVGGHRPIYIVDDVPSGGSIDPAFAVLEPLLMKYQVDVVLVGHVHNAYVTCPVYNGTCVAPPAPGEYAAPVHISIGNAGQGLTPINNTTRPAWATYQASEYGYATLHIWNSTALDVQLFGDDDNGLRTTMSLRRSFPRAGW